MASLSVLLAVSALVGGAWAFDAVVWSVGPSAISADKFVYDDALANVGVPLIIFRIDNFDLIEFNKFADVYASPESSRKTSSIKERMKASSGYDVTWLGDTAKPLPVDAVDFDKMKEAAFGTIVVDVKSLQEADALVDDVLAGLRSYVVVLTNKAAFVRPHQRHKRQAAGDDEPVGGGQEPEQGQEPEEPQEAPAQAAAASDKFPLAVYSDGAKQLCSLYIDTVELLVNNPNCKKSGQASCPSGVTTAVYGYSFNKTNGDTYTVDTRECTEKSAKFKVTATAAKSKDFTSVTFTMEFGVRQDWYWNVSALSVDEVQASGDLGVGAAGSITGAADRMGARSVKGFAYGCGRTDRLWVANGKKCANGNTCYYGLQFGLVKLEPFGAPKDGFSEGMDDCVALFSAPVWMGLLVGLFIVAVLVFALSMISALQVMDRFDDPRGKPLQINVKGE